MAGQREQSFQTTPNFRAAQQTAAPSTTTEMGKSTAAQVQGQGQAIQALGNAFSGFFNIAAQSLQQAADVVHKENLVQSERERTALKWQALADKQTGKPMDPRYADRQDYAGTFITAQADDDAFKMTEAAKLHMSDMPLDGSVNPEQYMKDWYEREVGKGTGDPQYDARKLYTFTQQAQSMVAKANEDVRKTVETNTLNTVLESTKSKLNASPDGLTAGEAADLHQRLLTMARGNVAQADKWHEGIVRESVTNYGQALGTLKALYDDGSPNSWAARNPAAYTRLSDDLFKQTHRIKTFEAGMAVQQWNQDFQALVAQPGVTPAQIMDMEEKAYQIDSRHGVGPEVFRGLDAAFKKSLRTKAEVSVFGMAVNGAINGIHDGPTVATHLGKSVGAIVNENYELGLRDIVVQRQAAMPALAETIKTYGIPNAVASEQATQEFMAFLSDPIVQAASPKGTSEVYKQQLGGALMGRDPAKIAQVYRGYRTLEDKVGSEVLEKYFPNDETYGRFLAMKAYIGGDIDAQTAGQYFANGGDIKPLTDAAKGRFEWSQFKPGAKPAEVDLSVDKAITAAMRKHTGSDGWFSGIDSSLPSKDARRVREMLYRQATYMRQMTGEVDFDKAADVVAQQIAKGYTFLPGQGKHYQMVPNPYGSKGTELGNPLNIVNGKPVYALGNVKDVDGQLENTAKTFREDMAEFKVKVPGLMTPHGQEIDGKDIALGLPDNNGLHPMLMPSGAPIRVIAGQKLAMPDKVTDTGSILPGMDVATSMMSGYQGGLTYEKVAPVDVPKGEAEAFKFLQSKAPPGVFYVKAGVDPASGSAFFEPRYGARIKNDYDKRKETIQKREANVEKRRNSHEVFNPIETIGM